MALALYLDDSYLKETEATVAKVNGKFVIFDKTIFYAVSGGQPHDTGKVIRNNEEFNVIFVKKFGEDISHEVDKEGLKEGDKVKLILNWERRYKLMRMHTATHLICNIFHKEAGALITGNALAEDKTRVDFNLENFDKEKIKEYISEANELISKGAEIKTYYMDKEEVMKNPDMVKLANVLPPDIQKLRIVQIGDIDTQADGGTHVKDLKEVGKIEFLKAQNKGKNNRRVYFKLSQN